MQAKQGTVNQGRRSFIKAGAALGGGLLIGFYLWDTKRLAAADQPNAWIRISPDDVVTIIVDKSEMGQGVTTALPMLVAEELEVDLRRVRTEFAPVGAAYENHTGGSASVRSSWDRLRRVGATAREMLITAAARTWNVKEETCRAENGAVIHSPTGRHLTYGALADKAAVLPVPQRVGLKEPKDFKIIGKPTPRLDTPMKVGGRARFGLDMQLPGMLTAVVVRCPVFGGRLKSFDAGRTTIIPGVRHVMPIESGVAVVASNFWAARQGAAALTVHWDEGPLAKTSSADITKVYARLAQSPGAVAQNKGDGAEALKGAPRWIETVYEAPFLAHATMEPMNCTAHVHEDSADIWVPTQSQDSARQTAAEIVGLSTDAIRVHTTFLGGGFGRRAEQDFVAEAVRLSKATGAPIKVVWTREDDMHHDFYRPATYNVLRAALGKDGTPVAWTHRIVGPSILARWKKNKIDSTSVAGAANLPYGIPNVHVDYVMHNPGIPVGFWRSVGSSQNAFVAEGFMDELAHAGGHDPFEFRRRLLAGSPRHKAVLELAAAKANWGSPLPQGVARGIAVHGCFGSYVAEVAEVSVGKDGKIKVNRVVCAVDCGMVVNPDTVKAQMESGIVYGLTAALKSAVTIKNGRVEQGNFNDHPLLRIDEMPGVEVHIAPSREAPGGVGEPGVPPIAPAVANAVFAATGRRIRRLPIRPQDLRQA